MNHLCAAKKQYQLILYFKWQQKRETNTKNSLQFIFTCTHQNSKFFPHSLICLLFLCLVVKLSVSLLNYSKNRIFGICNEHGILD